MTPERAAEIRAMYEMWDSTNEWKFGDRLADMVPDLLDALEAAWAERDEVIESYRDLREKCNDAYLQRDAWQFRANTAETKVAEWRDASFAVDAQLRHAQAERDALLEEVKDYEDSGLTECRARYWRERAERDEAEREEQIQAKCSAERRLHYANAALARCTCGAADDRG